jgi:TolB-like protein/DNA-binding winged helix-turn-helix (wHTH) protein
VPVTIFEFGEFSLDCDRFQLRRAGRRIRLEHKPMELLILLSTREGDLVTRAEIAERLWGSEVFVDTEHGINTAIRKIRQTLRDDPEEPRFVQTVMGRGYRFIEPITKLPPSPSAENGRRISAENMPAAAPDSVPMDASRIESPATIDLPGRSRTSHLRRWIALGASALLVLFILAISLRAHWSRGRLSVAAAPNIHALAVLPLDNLSGDPAQNYFADGMTDELTTMLAKNSTLHVTSRTSAMQYKGAHRPLREIAEELGVDGILEGSVARADGKVHMTIQLIQADTDTHLWAESYDRDANDVVTLPTEAAQAIAKRLNSSAPLIKPARYVNPEAHDAYLRGMYLFYTSGDASGPYFKKAIALQPDYAPSWAGLAMYYGSGAGGSLDPKKVLEPMEAAARKAVELDDSLPEAHLALGSTLFYNKWDWAGADRELLRAIELDPQFAEAIHRRASFLAVLNRHQEAIATQKKATEIDAFARPRALALSYVLARQYDAAITDIQQRLQTKPDDEGLLYTLYVAYRSKGMKKEAIEALEQYIAASGDDAPRLGWKTSAEKVRRTWERGGYNAVLQAQISDLERKAARQYVSPVDLALLYAQLGEREKTLALLEAGLRERNPSLLWVQCDPAYDFLHNDERYRSIIRKIGLPPAWS